MNIFVLHWKPRKAARWHVDKHIVKMILETCQLLYTAHWIHFYPHLKQYKSAVALSKAMLNASLDSDRQSAFALEAASQAAAFAAPEPAAQVEAILGKQRPAFSGLKYARG